MSKDVGMLNGKLTVDELEMLAEKNGKCWLEEAGKREALEREISTLRVAKRDLEDQIRMLETPTSERMEAALLAIASLARQSKDMEFHQLRGVLNSIQRIAEVEIRDRLG